MRTVPPRSGSRRRSIQAGACGAGRQTQEESRLGRWANGLQSKAVVLGVFFVRPSFQWLGESVGLETVLKCWRVGLPAFARTVLKCAGTAVDLRHALYATQWSVTRRTRHWRAVCSRSVRLNESFERCPGARSMMLRPVLRSSPAIFLSIDYERYEFLIETEGNSKTPPRRDAKADRHRIVLCVHEPREAHGEACPVDLLCRCGRKAGGVVRREACAKKASND